MLHLRILLCVAAVSGLWFTPVLACEEFARCRSCPELAEKIERDGQEGEYRHGVQQNGLYYSFVLNCQELGEKLLQQGINPSRGGVLDSMALTVSLAEPHQQPAINQAWADLLLRYGATAHIITATGESAPEAVKHGRLHIDYPEIWQRFLKPRQP